MTKHNNIFLVPSKDMIEMKSISSSPKIEIKTQEKREEEKTKGRMIKNQTVKEEKVPNKETEKK
jgi:hypothetical protein